MKRILVAYDGTAPARKALDTAAVLAKRFEATIAVVSVVPVHPGLSPIDPWDDREVHAQELDEAKQILAEHGLAAELLEPFGDPAHEIEDLVRDGGYDTVVVGSRAFGALSRFLQPSVSEHVAANANATVVIAR